MPKEYAFDAVVFDLDGVITKTARVHADAWKAVFDEYLRMREKRDGEPFKEFTKGGDYLTFVDGKPRIEGIKSFLKSRNIEIPVGQPDDGPNQETIHGIGNKKNAMFKEILKKNGVEYFEHAVNLVRTLRREGLHTGVASSSKNCELILRTAQIEDLFETRVDGIISAQLGLKGKPEGDIFVRAAKNMGVTPDKAVVMEDASAGVRAGRNGGFGLVLGVARKNNRSDLLKNGADMAVRDFSEITVDQIEEWFHRKPQDFFKSWDEPDQPKEVVEPEKTIGHLILNPHYKRTARSAVFRKPKLAVFLDYDGTLTPIVSRPDLAVMSESMRLAVKKLAQKHTVAVVSGRMRSDVQNLVKIDGLFYAGSHGFDIEGPQFSLIQPKAKETIPLISKLITELKKGVGTIEGCLIEEKKFSVAVHYRLVKTEFHERIEKSVLDMVGRHPELRMMRGKMVFEILPNIDWNKGKAVRWIMEALKLSWSDTSVIYIGDDVTDEDAFRVIRTRGTGILVSDQTRPSAADFQVSTPAEVGKLFERIIQSK